MPLSWELLLLEPAQAAAASTLFLSAIASVASAGSENAPFGSFLLALSKGAGKLPSKLAQRQQLVEPLLKANYNALALHIELLWLASQRKAH